MTFYQYIAGVKKKKKNSSNSEAISDFSRNGNLKLIELGNEL